MSATVCAAGSASRSLMTTRAPSLASLSAISRPMPRPEPETMATLPSSLRFMCSLLCPVSVPSDARLAGELVDAVLVGGRDVKPHAAPAFVFELLGNLAGAADALAHLSDRSEAHIE